jgi:predicted phosphodiesterase
LKIDSKQAGAITTLIIDNKEQKFFFTSDVHFDSVYCNRKVFFQDLDEAVKQNALICIIGDFFDTMDGRFDPRRDMSILRPEYRRKDYYDYVIVDAAEKLEKYTKNIALITPGNHELSVLKNANTYLSDRLVSMLNTKGGNVLHGGYGGWIRIMMRRDDRFEGTVRIKYFHGSGGEAPVTRGAIQTNRQAVYLPDADIVINGHSHNSYWIPITRERLSNKGVHYFDTQHHVRTPGYMQSYGDGSTGWEVTRGGVPKPVGGCFITVNNRGVSEKSLNANNIEINPLVHNPSAISPVNDMFNGMIFAQE